MTIEMQDRGNGWRCYHTGILAKDRDPSRPKDGSKLTKMQELDQLATKLMAKAERGEVYLVQKRYRTEHYGTVNPRSGVATPEFRVRWYRNEYWYKDARR